MTAATVSRTRKPRTSPASLIATEFVKYQTLSDGSIWHEVVLPTPIKQHPESLQESPIAPQSISSPLIIFMVAYIVIITMIKLVFGAGLIITKILQKITPHVTTFIAAQLGTKIIDYRVYAPIFDLESSGSR
jgi:hypothetical protein